MKEKESIGSRIKDLVYKSNISITDFAKQICCSRENVYKIFERNSIDIELLARISKVLNYNFFEDIASDYDLALPVVDEEEEERRRAICQFLDIVPGLMRKYNLDGTIVIGGHKKEEDDFLPDYVLSDLLITVTVGETLEERANGRFGNVMEFLSFKDDSSNTVLLCNNKCNRTQSIDIKLVYKTEEEWEKVLLLALKTANENYTIQTWNRLNTLKNF